MADLSMTVRHRRLTRSGGLQDGKQAYWTSCSLLPGTQCISAYALGAGSNGFFQMVRAGDHNADL